jgi:hypothetical protein
LILPFEHAAMPTQLVYIQRFTNAIGAHRHLEKKISKSRKKFLPVTKFRRFRGGKARNPPPRAASQPLPSQLLPQGLIKRMILKQQ